MAVYLPLLTALIAGETAGRAAFAELVALAAIVVVLLVALRFGSLINRLVFSADDEVLLLRVFGLALLVAGIAEQLQVSSAVGAFLIGLALSGQVAEGARTLLSPLRDLFAAVFFVFFGLDTDPAQIPPVLGLAAALALLTGVTKAATGWWAARQAGIGVVGRVRAGTAIIARGEFNIVIAGLAAHVEPGLGPLAAAYVLLLAVAGPIAARFGEPFARRFARVQRETRPQSGMVGAGAQGPQPGG
jgi:CPA2 family monovalent cation:H+ antiporter-2